QVAGLGHADPARHDRAAVDAFQAAGSTDGNAPGLQPRHRAHCYGAYVFGPDGNNVEAVCHAPV
ncbi:MAG: putative glyoxalase, partial [Proteobacteria bacterium]|nr:putative glyoxalase [Pseudomonadota bacterium]